MDRMTELLQRRVKNRRRHGFLGADDRLHMAASAAGAIAEFPHEELKIVGILRARLEENVGMAN